MIIVKNLIKHYGTKEVLKNLSFEVRKGEIFGLLGPNGAGKTTTLETILGLKKRTSGSIIVLGKEVSGRRDKSLLKKIGVQFQEFSYQSNLKVWESVEYIASLYNIPYSNELLNDLKDKKNQLISTLSGGEKQKLSILLATIHNPGLLFLDELTTGLDPIARREVWDFIKKINCSGTTIVLTSHFMDEVEHLCNRGAIIHNGRIIQSGDINDLVNIGKGKSLEESYINIIKEVSNESPIYSN